MNDSSNIELQNPAYIFSGFISGQIKIDRNIIRNY